MIERIVGKCGSCGKDFQCTERGLEMRGNFCIECCSKIDKIHRLRILLARKEKSLKNLDEIDRLQNELLRTWNIELETYDKERDIDKILSMIAC